MDDWSFGDDWGDLGGGWDAGDYGGGNDYFGGFNFDSPSMDFPVPMSPEFGFSAMGNPMATFAGGGAGAFGGSSPFMQPQAPPQQQMQQAPQQAGANWGSLLTPQSLLGLGGGIAGLAGALAGGGKGVTNTPQMSREQRAVGTQTGAALDQMGQFSQGQSPLQQQQMSLLSALASGQGLPPGYAALVEQAFQPQMGSITQQAIESARRRGFAGGAELLNQGPGGAIAGPALADLQGQMAQAKLGLMQSLPQLYNQPIQTQGNFAGQQAQGFNNLFRSFPVGQQQSQPMGPQIGQAIGSGLQGLGTGMDQQQQQLNFQNWLMTQQQKSQPQPLSGANY